MRTRSLLLYLGLYGLLAWVWAGYNYFGKDILQKGLLWTAIGVCVVLIALVLERVWAWYRAWRVARASQASKPRAMAAHEDDVALAALWDEARSKLTASPEYGRRGRNLDLAALPLFLVSGPTGAGKTSTILNSGVEPQLLAGQTRADSGVAPTRVANFFLCRDALFVEVSGRIWEGEIDRWKAFLGGFTDQASGPWWKRFLHDAPRKPGVRGILLFGDFSSFREKADPEKVSRSAKREQERLQAICDVLGSALPVYAVFTKTDTVAFFDDFFARLQETEYGQPLGSVPAADSHGAAATADQTVRRFTKAFNTIWSRLADQRIPHLSRENDKSRKPGIYEFPREFRRHRAALLQFLSEAFRPNPLKASPALRGMYFTAIRMVEQATVPAAINTAWTAPSATSTEIFRPDATAIFRPEATELFRPGSAGPAAGSQGLKPRWMFARDLFEKIVPQDRPPRFTVAPAAQMNRARQIVAVAACAIAVLAGLTWFQSWLSNRKLIADAQEITRATASLGRQPGVRVPTEALQRLDSIRAFAERLDQSPPMRMRWGLYAGNSLREPIRTVYFDRFDALLLGDLNRFVVDKLGRLPETPAPGDPFEPAYSELATHLKITGGSCQMEGPLVAGVLKVASRESGIAGDDSRRQIVDRQIDFYAAALSDGPPVSLVENPAAVVQARQYLSHLKSPERAYRAIRQAVTAKLTATMPLAEVVPEYRQVLTGPGEMPEFFSAKGRDLFEKEIKNPGYRADADACVIGAVHTAGGSDPNVEREIRRLYAEDYRAAWKDFLAKFQVTRYAGSADAVRRLDILASQRSPILGVLAFTSMHTYFADQRMRPSDLGAKLVETARQVLDPKTDPVVKKLEKMRQEEPKESFVQVTEAFQPVHAVVTPASEKWVSEKNKAYLDALAEFRLSLQAIARSTSSTPDPVVHQAALAARDKAFETVRQMAQDFQPIGTGGIDMQVRNLLEQPIRNGSGFIVTNPDKAAEGKLNGQLAGLCAVMRPALAKYPFSRNATAEISLQEIASLFAPGSGAVWKYQQDSLGEFVVRDGNRWVRKPDVPKPRIADVVIDLLNRSQQISNAFHSGGGNSGQPNLHYSLRPADRSLPDQRSLEFNFDGRAVTFAKGNVLQKSFQWPPGPSHRAQAKAITPGLTVTFAYGSGIWGVFRIFADAEPRALDEKNVEWKHNRVAGQEMAPMDPPVRMQFVEFPGGVDLFNPLFFGSLQCPTRAVQ